MSENYIIIEGIKQKHDFKASDLELAFMEKINHICAGANIRFEARSDNYLSVLCGDNDFIRFRLTDRTKWFSINVLYSERAKLKDSPLFAQQENKKLVHWKTKINDLSDVDAYSDIIRLSCVEEYS